MNTVFVCQDGNNPYLNNPDATEVAPQSQETYEGRLYTKLSYEVNIYAMARLLKIIQVVALAIISCFIALAFEHVRKLLSEGINGFENVTVLEAIGLRSSDKVASTQDISEEFEPKTPTIFENKDVMMHVASTLSVKDLLSMRAASRQTFLIAQAELINRMNALDIYYREDLGISTEGDLIDFFGESHSKILSLKQWVISNLEDFLDCYPHSSAYFTKMASIICLKLQSGIPVKDFSFLQHCHNLKELDLSDCLQIKDFNFLQYCSSLKILDLSGCQQIDDISFVQRCPQLEILDLCDCRKIDDISFVQKCQQLRSLNLSTCYEIKDISFLQHCKQLEILNLTNCEGINDISFLRNCPRLTSLTLQYCKGVNKDFSFMQYCQNLKSLDLTGCHQITDFSFLQHLKQLTSLCLDYCYHISDFSFLRHCPNLKSLSFFGCNQIVDIGFLEHCKQLTTLNFKRCDQINDFKLLQYCPLLTSLDLSDCHQIYDFSFVKHCPKLETLNLYGCWNFEPQDLLDIDKGITVLT